MIIKMVLSASIIALSTLVGYLISSSFENRIKQLNALIFAIKIMDAEMNYSKNYLGEIINKLALNNDETIGIFFTNINNALNHSFGKDFSHIWNDAVEMTFKTGSLSKTDIKLLKDFGKRFGKIDLQNQKNIFEYFYRRFDLQLEEAINEKEKKSRVYRNLGVSVGIMIVVILI
ncbi:MAG: hypothetical protein GX285_07870 [Clostridiales bacterium]|nr:hypothetical protein [Clostridiales bacterium]